MPPRRPLPSRPPIRPACPAVARAIQALEHLAAAQQPLSLSALSRAIDVGPSSLLAILTTLRGAGLVSRSPRDGRYLPGPGLVALGTAAAQRLEPLHTFDCSPRTWSSSLGETVLLWIQQGDGLAMAAAREGSSRCATSRRSGLRLPASGWAARTDDGVVEGELEPGVWMLGASLDERALLAVVGPAARLRGAAGAAARAALRAVGRRRRRWAGSGPIEPTRARRLPSQALVASLSYLSDDGYPASVPLWYDWDGTAFWLVPSPRRRVGRARAAQPARVAGGQRVDAAVAARPGARADAGRRRPGRQRWRSVEGRLAARYARLDAARLLEGRSGQPRVLLRLEPERLIAWRGLLRPVAMAGGARA